MKMSITLTEKQYDDVVSANREYENALKLYKESVKNLMDNAMKSDSIDEIEQVKELMTRFRPLSVVDLAFLQSRIHFLTGKYNTPKTNLRDLAQAVVDNADNTGCSNGLTVTSSKSVEELQAFLNVTK